MKSVNTSKAAFALSLIASMMVLPVQASPGQPNRGDAPVKAELRFGALTKANVCKPVARGLIDEGDPLGHWRASGGLLCVSAAGDAANLSAGPYILRIGGQVVAVAIDPEAYDVTTQAEYDVALPLAAATPPNGRTIFLAPGMFFEPRMGFDNAVFEKVFSETPFRLVSRDMSNKATYSTVIHIRGQGLHFVGLKRPAMNAPAYKFDDADSTQLTSDIVIDQWEAYGVEADIHKHYANAAEFGNTVDLFVKAGAQGNRTNYQNITISNGKARYFRRGIVLAPKGTNYFDNNDLSAFWAQAINISRPDGDSPLTVYARGNVIYHPIGRADAGGKGNGPHVDALLISLSKTAVAGITAYVDDNRIYHGGSAGDFIGINLRDGVQRGVDSHQFFTGSSNRNIVAGGAGSELLLVENAANWEAISNTVVGSGEGQAGQFKIGHITSSGTHTIRNNIYEVGVFGGEPIFSGNLVIGPRGQKKSFRSVFVGPTFTPLTRDELVTQFRDRAGGPADRAGAGAISAN